MLLQLKPSADLNWINYCLHLKPTIIHVTRVRKGHLISVWESAYLRETGRHTVNVKNEKCSLDLADKKMKIALLLSALGLPVMELDRKKQSEK